MFLFYDHDFFIGVMYSGMECVCTGTLLRVYPHRASLNLPDHGANRKEYYKVMIALTIKKNKFVHKTWKILHSYQILACSKHINGKLLFWLAKDKEKQKGLCGRMGYRGEVHLLQ